MDILERFRAFVDEEKLVQPGDRLILAVSGGPDSMAMMDLFSRIEDEYNLGLIVAHFDHMMRAESSKDAAFVCEKAREYGMRCVVGREDVPKYAESTGSSLEESARHLRYRFLEKVRKEFEATSISVAHNMDDLVETMVYRLVKGCGPFGMVAMLPKKGRIIRPLLPFTSEELRNYVTIKGIEYVVDPSNLDRRIPRNLIRHEIVPKFRSINPGFHAAIWRFYRLMRECRLHIETTVERFCSSNVEDGFLGLWKAVKLDSVKSLDSFMMKEALRRMHIMVSTNKYPPDYERIEKLSRKIREETGESWKLQMGNGVTFEKSGSRLFFLNENSLEDWEGWKVSTGCRKMGKLQVCAGRVEAEDQRRSVRVPENSFIVPARDVRKVKLRGVDRKVRDVLREYGIPASFRQKWPVVVWCGKVVWIAGIGKSDEYLEPAEGLNLFLRGEDLEAEI